MDENLTYVLHEMIWLMDGTANRLLKERYDITFRKFYVLAVLASCEPTTQVNLAECMGQSAAAVSKSLAVLEQEYLVRIDTDPAHKRKNMVYLTDKGKQKVGECSAYLETIFQEKLQRSGVDIETYTKSTILLRDTLRE